MSSGEIKLGDDGSSSGILQVYHNNQWGTICNAGFTQQSAEVICGLMGYR